MVVNSIIFLLFFLVVFVVYYFGLKGNVKAQNTWLLLASYFFYGFAEWKMLPLLLLTTAVFYGIGIAIGRYNKTKEKFASVLTALGTVIGIAVLLYFKYLNFFIESFSEFFNVIGLNTHWSTFCIIMPLGISFFTFKLISYLIEIHRCHIEPSKNFIEFATYISFFPAILSGPIDRPKPFLTQLKKYRTFDYGLAMIGLKRIFWGMFMKMCIADRLAIYVDAVFNNVSHHNGTTLAFASLLYPIQMYADFCGYSEMAIGVGGLLGLKMMENFKHPFFSQNIAEYWRKWHISLTGWLTDYVFMPLNLSFRGMEKWGSIWAIMITFILIGLWHGANWTFVLFGLYHGLLYIPLMLSGAFFRKKKQRVRGNGLPAFRTVLKMLGTYLLVALGLIFFKSATVSEVGTILAGIGSQWGALFFNYTTLVSGMCCTLILFYKEFRDEYFLKKADVEKKAFPCHTEFCISIYILLILIFGVFDSNQFIYFQF